MADFCFDCTADLWEADNGPRNDMTHSEPEGLWYLCESCGVHLFTPDGRRRCRRPQAEFHHVDGPSEWTPDYPSPCPTCIELEGEAVLS